MTRRKIRSTAAIIVVALITVLAWTTDASTMPQELHCVLTDTGTSPGSESRPIVIVFDEDVKTLKAEASSHSYSFNNVSISNVAINGEDDSVSLGIDRSSLGIVWQQYGASSVVTEYGQCRRTDRPAAAAIH